MNRQQRRLAARQARSNAEARAEAQRKVEVKDNIINDIMLEQFYMAAGMALNDLYGFGQKRIYAVWNRMNEIIYSIHEDADNFFKLRDELKERAGVGISWVGGDNERPDD